MNLRLKTLSEPQTIGSQSSGTPCPSPAAGNTQSTSYPITKEVHISWVPRYCSQAATYQEGQSTLSFSDTKHPSRVYPHGNVLVTKLTYFIHISWFLTQSIWDYGHGSSYTLTFSYLAHPSVRVNVLKHHGLPIPGSLLGRPQVPSRGVERLRTDERYKVSKR